MTKTDGGYEIGVRGHLQDIWLDWFEGLSLSNQENGEAVLILRGEDQALLHGVLTRLRDLNLPLLWVRRLEPPPETASERHQ